VYVVTYCTLNWGDHMNQVDPLFDPDGVHLSDDSPLRNAGDPGFNGNGETDIDGGARVWEGRVDIGADEISAFGIEHQYPPVIDTRREAKSVD
jgi:hypothetical protein